MLRLLISVLVTAVQSGAIFFFRKKKPCPEPGKLILTILLLMRRKQMRQILPTRIARAFRCTSLVLNPCTFVLAFVPILKCLRVYSSCSQANSSQDEEDDGGIFENADAAISEEDGS